MKMPREINYIPNKYNTASEYLTVPFMESQKRMNDENLNTFNILIGRTGQGKSYNLWNFMIPHYIEIGMKLIIASAPTCEIFDSYGTIAKAVYRNKGDKNVHIIDMSNGQYSDTYVRETLKLLDDDIIDTVVIIMTHAYWSTGGLNSHLMQKVQEYGMRTAFFADEIHTFLTSCEENYKNNMGHSSNYGNYTASFYKKVSQISSHTPHVWGLTATPTAEQRGMLSVGGKMKYVIVNEDCPKELIKVHNAFYRNIDLISPMQFRESFHKAIDKLVSENQMLSAYGMKKTMLVKCNYKYSLWDTEDAMNEAREYIRSMGYFSSEEKVMAIMTQDEKYIMSTNGSREYLDDQGIKDVLNDPENPAAILFVVQKGNAGMNVHTLKSLVSFRAPDYKDSWGNSVTHNSRQLMGRFVRANDKRTNDNEQAWIVANSIDMVLGNTSMLRDAVRQFKEDFFSIDQIISEEEKEEEMVCCEVCNGTGKVKAMIEQTQQSLNNSTVAKFFSSVVKS
jgi:hypothetical protein